MMRRLPLILILLVGIATPIAATLLFYFSPPSQHTARGEIMSPAQTPAEWDLQNGKWTLLFTTTANDCGAQCQKRLCQMRQLRLMLPGHYLRLQRAWLRTKDTNAPPELTASADCGESRAAAFANTAKQINITEGVLPLRGNIDNLPPPAAGNTRADYLYLIDPAGVYAMRFPPQLNIYAVRKDLAKLLKISKGRRKIEN